MTAPGAACPPWCTEGAPEEHDEPGWHVRRLSTADGRYDLALEQDGPHPPMVAVADARTGAELWSAEAGAAGPLADALAELTAAVAGTAVPGATLADVAEITARYADVAGPARHVPRGPVIAEPDRAAYLLAALDGVELGGYDRRVITWLAGLDDPTCRTVVAWLVRARRAGYAEAVAGRQ